MPSLSKVSPLAEQSAQLLLNMAAQNDNESGSNSDKNAANTSSETQIENGNSLSTPDCAKRDTDTTDKNKSTTADSTATSTDENKSTTDDSIETKTDENITTNANSSETSTEKKSIIGRR